MNRNQIAQRRQDQFDNMKKRYPKGSVVEQVLWPAKGPIMVTEHIVRPAGMIGRYVWSGDLVEIPASMLDQLVGGGRRKSRRRMNRSRKSRRR